MQQSMTLLSCQPMHQLNLANKVVAALFPVEVITSISADAASVSLVLPYIRMLTKSYFHLLEMFMMRRKVDWHQKEPRPYTSLRVTAVFWTQVLMLTCLYMFTPYHIPFFTTHCHVMIYFHVYVYNHWPLHCMYYIHWRFLIWVNQIGFGSELSEIAYSSQKTYWCNFSFEDTLNASLTVPMWICAHLNWWRTYTPLYSCMWPKVERRPPECQGCSNDAESDVECIW